MLEEIMKTLCAGGLPGEKGTSSNILDASAQLVAMMK